MKRIVTPPTTHEQIKGFYDNIQDNIDRYGFHIMGVMAGHHTPPFNYTIGLSDKIGFELFMCGLRNDYAAEIMHDYLARAREGLYLPDCVVPEQTLTNFKLMVAKCTCELDWLYSDFTVQIERFYGERKQVVQLIMADKEGNCPLDDEFDIEYMAQFQPLFCEII